MNNTNWKTFVVGLIGAVAVVLIPVLQTGQVTTQSIVTAIAIGLLSYFTKDKDVTGGNREQD